MCSMATAAKPIPRGRAVPADRSRVAVPPACLILPVGSVIKRGNPITPSPMQNRFLVSCRVPVSVQRLVAPCLGAGSEPLPPASNTGGKSQVSAGTPSNRLFPFNSLYRSLLSVVQGGGLGIRRVRGYQKGLSMGVFDERMRNPEEPGAKRNPQNLVNLLYICKYRRPVGRHY